MSRCYDIALNIKNEISGRNPISTFCIIERKCWNNGTTRHRICIIIQDTLFRSEIIWLSKIAASSLQLLCYFSPYFVEDSKKFPAVNKFYRTKTSVKKRIGKNNFFFSVPLLLAFVQNWMICIVSFKVCSNILCYNFRMIRLITT